MISCLPCERNIAKTFAEMYFLAEIGLLNSSSLGSVNSNIDGVMCGLGEPSSAMKEEF